MSLIDQGGDPSRRACLQTAYDLRKTRRTMATPDESGHMAFLMPPLDFAYWTQKHPELAASDPQIARKAWLKFLNTEQGEQYKVNPTEGRRMPTNGVIIK